MYHNGYLLDTNIILQDASNLFVLAQEGSNLIILAETVLDEIDAKKSGFDEINFQAREFARILENARVHTTHSVGEVRIVALEVDTPHGGVLRIEILSKEHYTCEHTLTAPKILNDRKILEIAQHAQAHYDFNVIFVSLDIMARTRAVSLDIPASELQGRKKTPFDAQFVRTITIPFSLIEALEHQDITTLDPQYLPHYFGYMFRVQDSDHVILGAIEHGKVVVLDEESLRDQHVMPLNSEQLFFSHALKSPYYNIIIVEALAGSGKTLIALSGAMKLLRQKLHKRIIYIRNSIESTDRGEEVGFLPGLEEKFRIYNHPLMDSLEYIVRNAHKRKKNNLHALGHQEPSAKEVQARIEELITQFSIETMWVGEMRGRTLSDALVIIDEAQNMSNKTMQMVLSRIDASSKVVILGSNKQIDNSYLNRHTNALTTLLHATQKQPQNLNLFGLKLTKVLRGPITAWAEEIFSK